MDSAITYKPVGRCIYCGATEGDLDREHIIPFGLGGTWVLPASSCKSCAKITAAVEQFCLRNERPTTLPLVVMRADGSKEGKELPIEEHPITCIGFDWAAPRILDGKPPEDAFEGSMIVCHAGTGRDLFKRVSNGEGVKLGSVNMATFARMLAKIGHAYAVSNRPADSFEPMLSDLILGKAVLNASYLVGGDKSGPTPVAEPYLHTIDLQDCVAGGVVYTLARIRLFAFAGMPRYHVVVGRKLGPPEGKPMPKRVFVGELAPHGK